MPQQNIPEMSDIGDLDSSCSLSHNEFGGLSLGGGKNSSTPRKPGLKPKFKAGVGAGISINPDGTYCVLLGVFVSWGYVTPSYKL